VDFVLEHGKQAGAGDVEGRAAKLAKQPLFQERLFEHLLISHIEYAIRAE
jgi:hypothetical protein